MQGRVKATGAVTVDRLVFKFSPRGDEEKVNCEPSTCAPASCCPYEEEFAYQLAPEGVNTNIPVVPPADGVPQVFEATASAIYTCPNGTSSTGRATVTSTISYADALARAEAAAAAEAEANADCSDTPCACINDGFAPVFHGDSYDMAIYFLPGTYSNNDGEPWQIIDTDGEIYASGFVVGGTLDILFYKTTGDITWNLAGADIVNASASVDIYAGLQVACQGHFCEVPDPCICETIDLQSNNIAASGNFHFDIFNGIDPGLVGRPYRIWDENDDVIIDLGEIDVAGFPVSSSRLGPGDFPVYMTAFGDFTNNDSAGSVTVRAQIGCECGGAIIWP